MIHMDSGQADTLRAIALFCVVVSVAGFPAAIQKQGRVWSAWLAVIACELFMVQAFASIADHWHDPGIVWYRVPLSITGSVFMIMFAVQVFFTPTTIHNTRGGTREDHN